MRGRTWKGVAILDEAQNCTAATLKLFASRCGRESRIIICGDDTQCDLAGASVLGAMADAAEGAPGVAVVRLPADAQMRRPELVELMARWEAWR
jgi:phosphate starvation-inducible protein PhoH